MAGLGCGRGTYYALRCGAAKCTQARETRTKDATHFANMLASDFLGKLRRIRIFCSEQRSSCKLSSTEPLSEIFTEIVDFNDI
jgi:hypothetical protein